jgi:uncharacterized DUF497 family protein
LKIQALHWDDANTEHVARHGLSPADIEDVCYGEHLAFKGKYRRLILYGKTKGGEMIMVVLERIYDQVFRLITARSMTGNEKHSYRKKTGE